MMQSIGKNRKATISDRYET